MKKFLPLIFAASFAAPVIANDVYIGFGAGFYGYEESGMEGEYSNTTLEGRLGSMFNDYFGIEGRFGVGVSPGSDVELGVVKVEAEIENYVSALLVGKLPLNNRFAITGKAGFSSVSIKATASGPGGVFSVSDSGSSLSYFVGLEASLNSKASLFLEAGSLYDRREVSISGVSLGAIAHF